MSISSDVFTTLTDGERMRVLRKRGGMTQGEFGGLCGVTQQHVALWESGKVAAPPFLVDEELHEISELTEQELCVIVRRRLGWTQLDLARLCSLSSFWVKKIEAGGAAIKPLLDILIPAYLSRENIFDEK